MKRVLAVVAGIASGVLFAGALSPVLMTMVPPRLRAAEVLWAVLALSVALAIWAVWAASRPRRE